MKTKTIINVFNKLEPWLIIALVLASLGLSLPPIVSKLSRATGLFVIPLLISFQYKRFFYVMTRDIPLLLLTSLALLSFIWSATPDATIADSRGLIRSTILGIYIATRYSPKEQMKMMIWVSGIAMILSLIAPIVIPGYGFGHTGLWAGIFQHKNSLARMSAISGILFTLINLYIRKNRRITFIGIILSLSLLLLSQGKTALVIFCVLLFLLPVYKFLKQHYRLKVVLILGTLIVGAAIVMIILGNLETIVVDILGKDLGLNGRDELWTAVIERAKERPWLGYGYVGFWTNPEESLYIARNTWLRATEVRGHAHSGFIDLFVQLGWMGVLFYSLSLISVFFKLSVLAMTSKKIEFFWMLVLIVVLVLFNFNITNTILTTGSFWCLYVTIACSSGIYHQRLFRSVKQPSMNNQMTTNSYS